MKAAHQAREDLANELNAFKVAHKFLEAHATHEVTCSHFCLVADFACSETDEGARGIRRSREAAQHRRLSGSLLHR